MTTFYVTHDPDFPAGGARARRPVPPGLSRLAMAAVLAAGLAAACGGSPTRPTPTPPPPPTPAAPTLTCQQGVTLQSRDGLPVAYTVTPPTAQGGSAPVTVACDAAASFPVGTTTVTCTATDARQQQGTCSFAVTVAAPPKLPYTRFLAFGDSLTYGVVSLSPTFLLLSPTQGYPYLLQGHFMARYPTQTILVQNSGVPGELATDGGIARLPGEIYAYHPEVLLLMEGTNDLNSRSPDRVAQALDGMVRDAKERGVIVFIATVPPARPGRRPEQAANIPALNALIRDIALRRNAYLVDVYAPLAADMSLIGVDDLHPTPAGYEVMARTWLDAIVLALEPPAPTLRRPARWQ